MSEQGTCDPKLLLPQNKVTFWYRLGNTGDVWKIGFFYRRILLDKNTGGMHYPTMCMPLTINVHAGSSNLYLILHSL